MAKSRIPKAVLLLAMATFSNAFAESQTPRASIVTPRSGRSGVTLTISGTGLDRSAVDEVYLTDHRFDLKVKILEQSATTLKIRIPPFAKPGRLQLLFLTTGKQPVLLEQPL